MGGVCIRSLIHLNVASNLKLCWELINSYEDWVLRPSGKLNHHIASSIWNGIKPEYTIIMDYSCWTLGDGAGIKFWKDAWCDDPLVNELDV